MAKLRVLVVEDEAGIRDIVKTALEPIYEVLLATNGVEGVHQAAIYKPHLILLDIRMPGLDGLDVLRQLKMSPKTVGIPILILSALTDSSSVMDAQALGATDYFIKPLALDDIRQAMRKIIPTYLGRSEPAP